MVIGKIKPTATIVAQFAAGVEVEAIQHEGKMYLPIVGMGEFATKDTGAPARTAEPEVPASKGGDKKPAKGETKDEAAKTYTEDELMEMETKELLKLCKTMGIDPDETEGKNTNKKLRKLILAAQEEAGDEDEDDKDGDGDDDGDADELVDQIGTILEDFDGGKKNKKKTIAAICDLGDDVDKDAVTELVEKFEDDADADLDAMAEKIAAVVNGEEPEEDDDEDEKPKKGKKSAKKDEDEDEDDKPAKKGKGKKSKKDEDLVAVEDLEVGDRVSVWWNDDNQDWFDGEVKSISKKGKVVIAYDDDTEDAIDPEVHTKIKRIED